MSDLADLVEMVMEISASNFGVYVEVSLMLFLILGLVSAI